MKDFKFLLMSIIFLALTVTTGLFYPKGTSLFTDMLVYGLAIIAMLCVVISAIFHLSNKDGEG
ncbi:hypothetical protein LCGC14_0861780 [marine sediment metagenome]|uniref:Uncharacterized protein n=1 Tax=marine sediment metagenome TaxID=412755 RepID=A0A0F9PSM2_9ZZZZ